MKKPIKAVLLGAGNRGMTYGGYALENPQNLNFVAVAEPIKRRREKFAKKHNISKNHTFKGWQDLLNKEKLADIAIICTQDQMHTEPTIQALDKGYDILLEKPMAHTLEDCLKIVRKTEETDRILGVCHVLRYTDFFNKVKEVINSGRLGKIMNITHRENVAWYHFAHSYVRGEWAKRETSSPIILAKCCHDLDLLYWFTESPPARISSIGELSHFSEKNAPQGAPKYCVEGCPIEDSCLYYAPRIYIDIEPIIQIVRKSEKKFYKLLMNLRRNHIKILTFLSKIIPPLKKLRYWKDWPVNYLYEEQEEDYSDEAKMEILKSSPYGRCVYQSNNNVVDHQQVNIHFLNGITANLTMHGFSESEGRTLRIDGTKGTLKGEFMSYGEKIKVYDHYSGEEEIVFKKELDVSGAQHGGGDYKLLEAFIDSLTTSESAPLTNAREVLESHVMAFATDEARIEEKNIDMKNYRKKFELL
ncbi:MAG: Gfo/Idh/MocA family oxidoreductase [Promethearchaeota archaeon]|nr:MAG: Gfo/Idh/MocA family oxidoreductase [Candidatus Lokiarchaeota archaeon]